jgi:hypothetical protein
VTFAGLTKTIGCRIADIKPANAFNGVAPFGRRFLCLCGQKSMTEASMLETNSNRHNAPCLDDLKVGDLPRSSAKNLLEQTY